MTTINKAKEAGAIMQRLKLEIAKQGANPLAEEGYEAPNISDAVKQLNEQIERMALYQQYEARAETLNDELEILPVPGEGDLRWEERRLIVRAMGKLNWQGRRDEVDIQEKYERSIKQRRHTLEEDLTKVAKVQDKLQSMGVTTIICDDIARSLDSIPNEPGKRLQFIVRKVKEGYKGDQQTVREELEEEMKRKGAAEDDREVEEGIDKIKQLKSDWNRSVAMEPGTITKVFPEHVAVTALERLCFNRQAAIAAVRRITNTPAGATFELQAKEVLQEIERVNNMNKKGQKYNQGQAAAKEDKEAKDKAVVAMAASVKTESQGGNQSIATWGVCIQYNNHALDPANNSQCNRGADCRFSHVKTGQLMSYPKSTQGNRGRSPERAKRDRHSDDRGRQRSRSQDRGRSGGHSGGNYQQKGEGRDHIQQEPEPQQQQQQKRRITHSSGRRPGRTTSCGTTWNTGLVGIGRSDAAASGKER